MEESFGALGNNSKFMQVKFQKYVFLEKENL